MKTEVTFKKRTLKLFTGAQAVIFALFVLVTVFTLVRLASFGNLAERFTKTTLPELTNASTQLNYVQQLVNYTSTLSMVTSEPARRIVLTQINESLTNIRNVSFKAGSEGFIELQIDVLDREIKELDELVGQQISVQKQLEKTTNEAFAALRVSHRHYGQLDESNVEDRVINLSVLVARVGRQTRLHQLRQLERELSVIFDDLIKTVPSEDARVHTNQLFTLLLGDKGLLEQKIESLRMAGRARGRGNFVRNLADDISKKVAFRVEQLQNNAKKIATDAAQGARRQTLQSMIAGVAVTVITLLIMVMINRKIVVRLAALVRQVKHTAASGDNVIKLDGDDEIAELATAFDDYLQRLEKQESELRELTLCDPLTNIPNRRAFEQTFEKTLATARRHGWQVSVLLIDIDYFKRYNDRYGHTQGDECLIQVANTLNECVLRTTDFCARYGGEEFVCLLPDTDAQGALKKAEDLRVAIEKLEIAHIDSPISSVVTISVGIATFLAERHSELDLDTMLKNADEALYKAKDEGRNRCANYNK